MVLLVSNLEIFRFICNILASYIARKFVDRWKTILGYVPNPVLYQKRCNKLNIYIDLKYVAEIPATELTANVTKCHYQIKHD